MKRLEAMASDDIRTLQFKVVDDTGAVVNISGYTDIDVQVFALASGKPTGAAVISENLAGDVALVGGGTAGLFEVAFVSADTTSLSGDHWFEVRLEDASGNFLTALQAILPITGDLVTS